MPEPCRTCERRSVDFGGCRCQAFHLTGHAEATDPTCRFSPDHALIQVARVDAERHDVMSSVRHRKLTHVP